MDLVDLVEVVEVVRVAPELGLRSLVQDFLRAAAVVVVSPAAVVFLVAAVVLVAAVEDLAAAADSVLCWRAVSVEHLATWPGTIITTRHQARRVDNMSLMACFVD